MASVALEGVTRRFGEATVAVDSVDLSVPDGELLVLVGPSGCGKSTILRLVAGLDRPSEGAVRIADRVVNEVPPGERNVAMVFQDYALYPHMTAYQNMAFALKGRRTERSEIGQRVREAAELLGIDGLLDRRPAHLSGGERQRVAMGRAIVRRPVAFLMDEPLSNLDAKLRVQMRTEIRRLHHRLGATLLYVTHDQVEAMTLGDRVAVLRRGRLQQLDTPTCVYAAPANTFVAGFIGSPTMNLLLAPLREEPGGVVAQLGPWACPLTDSRALPGRTSHVVVGIRPEHFEDARFVDRAPDGQGLNVNVEEVEPLGASNLVYFRLDAVPVWSSDGGEETGAVTAGRPPALLVAQVDGRSSVRRGDLLQLSVDLSRATFFDADTGARLAGQGT